MDIVIDKHFEGKEHFEDVQQIDKQINCALETKGVRQKYTAGDMRPKQQTEEGEEAVSASPARLQDAAEECLPDTETTWPESDSLEEDKDQDCAQNENMSSSSLSLFINTKTALSSSAAGVDLDQVEPNTSAVSSSSLPLPVATESVFSPSAVNADLEQVEPKTSTVSSPSLFLPIASESSLELSAAGADLEQVEPKSSTLSSPSLTLPIATESSLEHLAADPDLEQVEPTTSIVSSPSLSLSIVTESSLELLAADADLEQVEPKTSTVSLPSLFLPIASESSLELSAADADLEQVEPKTYTVSSPSLLLPIAKERASELSASGADLNLVEPKTSTVSSPSLSLPITKETALELSAALSAAGADLEQVEPKTSTVSSLCLSLPIAKEPALKLSAAGADLEQVEPKTSTVSSPSLSLPIASESSLELSAADADLEQVEPLTSTVSSPSLSLPKATESVLPSSATNLNQVQANLKADTSATQQNKPNKNLSTQGKDLTKIDGFREEMNLKLHHVEYGNQLRRKLVDINQDNRICDRFELKPNTNHPRKPWSSGQGQTLGEGQTLGQGQTLGEGQSLGQGQTCQTLGEGLTLGQGQTLGEGQTLGQGHTLGEGLTLGQGQTLGQRESKGPGQSKSTYTNKKKWRSHGSQQSAVKSQKPELSTKRDKNKPRHPWHSLADYTQMRITVAKSNEHSSFMQIKEHLKQFVDSDEEDEDLPPLGSRVQRRLKGATLMELSKSVLGTVTKHLDGGYLRITWDVPKNDGSVEKIHYNRDHSHCNVDLVDSPRVLVDELIAEGCRVRRGIDWRYGDQDGGEGKLGSVYKVRENGTVKVRWDTGTRRYYKFGTKGIFELEIVGQDMTSWVKDRTPRIEAVALKSNDTKRIEIEEMNKRNKNVIQNRHGSEKEFVPIGAGGSTLFLPAYTSGWIPGAADMTSSDSSEAKRIEEKNKRNMTVMMDIHGFEKNNVPDGTSLTSPGGTIVFSPGVASVTSPDIDSVSSLGCSIVISPAETNGLPHDTTSVMSPDGVCPSPESTSRLSSAGTGTLLLDDALGITPGTYLNSKPKDSEHVNEASATAQAENVVQTLERKQTHLDDFELNRRKTKQTGVDKSESTDLDHGNDKDNASQIEESAGTKPKTGVNLKTGMNKNVNAQWSWLKDEKWLCYPLNENIKIENCYQKNPNGTAVIKLEGLQFRVVFLRMEQVNVQTKEKQCVRRRTAD